MDDATRARIAAHARELADQAPPFSGATRDRLAVLLRGAIPADTANPRPLRLAA
ncbi:hypothetical protein GCM10017562_59880 [Streptomyces roseofulvus]|uniref:hypothetical protein n=1 Tax=Streptomyces roseofulvus TaxID=33902 RepID=UPI0031FBCF54